MENHDERIRERFSVIYDNMHELERYLTHKYNWGKMSGGIMSMDASPNLYDEFKEVISALRNLEKEALAISDNIPH